MDYEKEAFYVAEDIYKMTHLSQRNDWYAKIEKLKFCQEMKEPIEAALRRAVEQEREACLSLLEQGVTNHADYEAVYDAIRARGEAK